VAVIAPPLGTARYRGIERGLGAMAHKCLNGVASGAMPLLCFLGKSFFGL
jgi:hypothetical protein